MSEVLTIHATVNVHGIMSVTQAPRIALTTAALKPGEWRCSVAKPYSHRDDLVALREALKSQRRYVMQVRDDDAAFSARLAELDAAVAAAQQRRDAFISLRETANMSIDALDARILELTNLIRGSKPETKNALARIAKLKEQLAKLESQVTVCDEHVA